MLRSLTICALALPLLTGCGERVVTLKPEIPADLFAACEIPTLADAPTLRDYNERVAQGFLCARKGNADKATIKEMLD